MNSLVVSMPLDVSHEVICEAGLLPRFNFCDTSRCVSVRFRSSICRHVAALCKFAVPIAIWSRNQLSGSRNTSCASSLAGSDALRCGFTANSGLVRIDSMCWLADVWDDVTRAREVWGWPALEPNCVVRGELSFGAEATGCSRSRWARNEVVSSVSNCWLSRGDSGSCGCIFDARKENARRLAAVCMAESQRAGVELMISVDA